MKTLTCLPLKPVEHQLHVGAYAARFAELHAGQFEERRSGSGSVSCKAFRIYAPRVERRLLHAAYAAARDNDLFESGRCRLQDTVRFFMSRPTSMFFSADGTDKAIRRAYAFRPHLETEPPLSSVEAAVVRAFQTDGGESDCRAVFLHHLSREPCGACGP